MFITNHITELQAIASIFIIVAAGLLFVKIIIYAKISKKSKGQDKSRQDINAGCNQLATLEDWQEFGVE